MGRRIRVLGVLLMVCFGLVVAQLVNIQLVRAPSLANSQYNPRVEVRRADNPRGSIFAADGTVLAKSVRITSTSLYPFHYTRTYPTGSVPGGNIYAGVVGYDSPLYYGTAGIEEQYNSLLRAQVQGPRTLSQILFRQTSAPTTNDVTLTLQPKLQQAAWNALTSLPVNNDGAVVVMNPSTGAIEAMVSNPIIDPNLMSSTTLATEKTAYFSYIQKDHEGNFPLTPFATGVPQPPGSTFKVVTSAAALNLKPAVANFAYPVQQCQSFPDGKPICDQSGPCGGTMAAMLPFSCDPGYAELGVQEGVQTLTQQAQLFGYDAVPPIDLPAVAASSFSSLPASAKVLLGQSAIGQYNDKTTALQNAMVAAGVANGGVIMTPHLMSRVSDSQGNLVQIYTPKGMTRTMSPGAAQKLTSFMEGVTTHGTATGVFPAYLCAAAKTGTAQIPNRTDDWMIAFAPANHPTIAVAVVVPNQSLNQDGAGIAGPIVRAVLEAALPQGSIKQPCTVP